MGGSSGIHTKIFSIKHPQSICVGISLGINFLMLYNMNGVVAISESKACSGRHRQLVRTGRTLTVTGY